MEADPNHSGAVRQKMYYLTPKWHGSAEAMLAFGRELLAGGNWEAGLPFELVQAHKHLATLEETPSDYYKRDYVWQDCKAVYDGALKYDPESTWFRTEYARAAVWCGRWTEAKALFDKLGDKVEVGAFADRAEMKQYRALAEHWGK
jgi:hypothetical protein